MAVYTQAQLDASRAALAAGVSIVQFEGRRMEYRSLDELQRIIEIMQRDLGQAQNNGNRFSLAGFNRA